MSGASTLTMQVVRISRGNPPRTFPEKAREAVLALKLDAVRSKDEILALYAHHAPFGGNVVGIGAASWRYFGRPAGDLSWAEAATLAVLPNQPGLLHPGRGRAALKAKRDALLTDLHEREALDDLDLQLALAEPLPGAPRPFPRLAPHLLDRAGGPGHHRTTLDRSVQAAVEDVAARHRATLAANEIHGLALLVAEVGTGRVVAYVGNAPGAGDHGGAVDVLRARRSTGSLLKPFLYAARFADGSLLPDQIVADVPLRFGAFVPENFDRTWLGILPASEALARSRNVPAVKLLADHGVDRFLAELRTDWGLVSLDRAAADYGLSLVLGGAESTAWELAEAYRTLARAAADTGPAPALHWRHDAADLLDTPQLEGGAAWATLQALQDVRRPGVHGAWRTFASSRRVAWKTGTSMGFRDGWAIGVTPDHVVAIWAGNPDGEGRPGLTGFQAAAPALFEVLDVLPSGAWFAPPDDLVTVQVCTHSGHVAGPDCPSSEARRVPRGAHHATACPFGTRVALTPDHRARVHAGCAGDEAFHVVPWFVLPPDQARWAARHRVDVRPPPPWRAGCEPPGAEGRELSLIYPPHGAQVVLPRELDGEAGAVVLEAAHVDPDATLHWHLDGTYLASTDRLHQVRATPRPGEHTVVVVDGRGTRITRTFAVRGAP